MAQLDASNLTDRTLVALMEKVGKVPKGAILHVLEMMRPNEDGIRRALVQDAWGKSSGWLTAVDVGGEANLAPVQECAPKQVEDEFDRGAWLQDQQQYWQAEHFPRYDSIPKQQETNFTKHTQLKQMQHRRRQVHQASPDQLQQAGRQAPPALQRFHSSNMALLR